MPIRTLDSEGGGLVVHIDWRRELVSARMLRLEGGVDCEIPHWLGEETKHSL